MKIIALAILVFLSTACMPILNHDKPENIPINNDISGRFPDLNNRWALLIGISKYADPNLNLSFADKDAMNVYNSLINICRFPKDNIKLFVNEKATYENIRKAIEGWLYSKTNKDDKIIIFFSGHGYRDVDNNGDEADGLDEFLLPYDYSNFDVSSAIRDDSFASWVKNLKSENVLLVIDSCFSGGVAKAKGISNNKISLKGIKGVNSLEKDIIGEIPRKGIALMSASQADQYSLEDVSLKMGVFTNYFIRSLDKTSDMNLDNIVNINEAFTYLKSKVTAHVRDKFNLKQEPILINTIENQFDLAFIFPDLNRISGLQGEIVELKKRLELKVSFEKSIEILEQILLRDPLDTESRSKLASYCYISGLYDKAIFNYEILISMNQQKMPKWKADIYIPRYYESLAEAYEKKERYNEAIGYLLKAIELRKASTNKEELWARYAYLGRLYFMMGQYEEAIQYYLQSLQENRTQDTTYFNLVLAYIRQKMLVEAENLLDQAIGINPEYADFYYLKSVILRYLRLNEADSLSYFNKYLSLDKMVNSDIEILRSKIELFEKLNANALASERRVAYFNEALNEVEKFLKDHSFICDGYIVLVQLCEKNNLELDKAKTYLSRLIELYPFFEQFSDNIMSLKPLI